MPALVDAGFQVITYDQRGYGASDKPDEVEAYSIPFLAIDVTAILDHLGIERAHVVGHDWGAAVVWAIAITRTRSRRSSRRRCRSGIRVRSRRCRWRSGRSRGTCSCSSSRSVAEEWLTANDGANFRDFAPHPDFDAVFAEYIGNGSLTPGLNYYRANVPPAALVGPPLELPPIQAPTMGVWSSDDFALLEPQMNELRRVLREHVSLRARRRHQPLVAVGGAGHASTALLLDFLPR